MSCANCADNGLTRLNWADAPDDFAVCLCHVGLDMRVDQNNGKPAPPLWRVWCAKHQVSPERVFMVEDVLTAEEMAERGLVKAPTGTRESTLLTAAKRPKR
jgi:histidinol phosphatase-like enzyme